MMTVHPLGGCSIGADCAAGVVDHKCRVFDGTATAAAGAVHEGLYVLDGSVIPTSLGIHPLLTITAIAERAMLLFARDRGLAISGAPPRRQVTPPPEEPIVAARRPTGFWSRLFGKRH
jgi:cholesterol oxidase